MSLKSKARSNRRDENFSSTRRTSCLESRNQTFLGSGGRNESNSHPLARISEKKIFHEVDVHHVRKAGIIIIIIMLRISHSIVQTKLSCELHQYCNI